MDDQHDSAAETVKGGSPRERHTVGIVTQAVDQKEETAKQETAKQETTLVSVVIPALNEKEGIVQTIKAIPYGELERHGYVVQVIVVDNGSDDGTGQLAKEQGAEVIFEPKRGYGNAFRAGFAHAKGDVIVTADADGTYPLGEIPRLVNLLRDEDLEFVTTNRLADIELGAMSLLHRFGNGVLNLVFRILYRADLMDSQSGMWVFRREILEDARLKSTSMPLSEELKIEAIFYQKRGWREVPITYSARLGDAKISSWKHGFENLAYLFKKRVAR